MFALVDIDSDECNSSLIVIPSSELNCINGKNYLQVEASQRLVTVKCFHGNELLLQNLLFNINNNLPYTLLEKIETTSCEKLDNVHTFVEEIGDIFNDTLSFEDSCQLYLDEEINTGSSHADQVLKSNRNKKHYCLYCGQFKAQIARHLVCKHRNEQDIQNAMAFPMKSKERNLLLEKIRKLGDKEHNQKGKDIITVGATNGDDAVVCPKCNGYYNKKYLRKHIKKCKFSYLRGVELNGISRVLMADIHPKANKLMRDYIFPRIRRDDYFKLITQDESLVLFGNINAVTYLQTNQHHDKMVAQHLRLLCRIFITMSTDVPTLTCLKDMINAVHYDTFVMAVKKIAGYANDSIDHPTVMNAACNAVRRFATFLRCLAIKQNNTSEIEIFDRFIYLLTHSQNLDLTKIALEKRTAIQRKRKVVIPTRDEINALLTKIDEEIMKSYNILSKTFDLENWKQLTKMLLIYIMIFCRKRPGDIERLEMQEYNRINVMEGDFITTMDENKRNLAHQLARCVTRGKLNQNASILILRKHIRAIELLKTYRYQAGVATNKFLWADPDKKRYDYFTAHHILVNFCKSHNLNTQKFSATRFRYHLASSTSRLDSVKQGVISKFMGHEEGIHQKIYQKQPIQSDVFTMGDILFTCNGFTRTVSEENNIQPITEVINSLSASWLERDEMEGTTCSPDLPEVIETENSSYSNLPTTSLISDEPKRLSVDCTTPTKRSSTPSDSCIDFDVNVTPIKKRLPLTNCQRKSWMTPERKLTRELFKSYYAEKRVPSLEECLYTADGKLSRGPAQIRNWIKLDLERNSDNARGCRRWRTPQKQALRQVFRPYYEGKRPLKYPSIAEMNEAIETIPELREKTTSVIRSQLQHDYKYVQAKQNM